MNNKKQPFGIASKFCSTQLFMLKSKNMHFWKQSMLIINQDKHEIK